ncbi:hypothetical protein BDZ85DRAFT_233174 [Elsinoe ampelina]|uniref:SET domain-containing protein n=1 Tax=Elsinoe ampelina TaxID=302913 RepID=A0A6A6GH46_9PEZI|nr:hypothetical protein BDZ85DRAFT_233174 [Elsinoe ampelina]
MIREGKEEGWLQLPSEALPPWAALNNIKLHDIKVGVDPVHPERGAGIFAQKPLSCPSDSHTTLMTVPRDLILSKERIEQHAKVDRDFRDLLSTLGEFGQNPRTLIPLFLLTQSYLLHPSPPSPHFTHTPLTTYLRLLPLPPLPTLWPPTLLPLLRGTTLLPALRAKLTSLNRDFTTLQTLSALLPWTTDLFSDADGLFTFPDWIAVDGMYRSRALEFPGVGPCMAPGIDMANHCGGEGTKAIYEVDGAGDGVLLLRAGKEVGGGEEVTITYGDGKGACEMVFSYGFLEEGRESAGELFLDLGTGEDPLGEAKRAVAGVAPGVKIVDCLGEEGVRWEGEWVWLVVVNEEDGLEFMVQRTVEGEEELRGFWKGEEIKGAVELKGRLEGDERWDLWRLRAVSVLQGRVEEQLAELYGCEDEVNGMDYGEGTDIPEDVRNMAMKLRELEGNLLEKAYAFFEEEKEKLAVSEVVTKYLAAMNTGDDTAAKAAEAQQDATDEDEDFS